MNCRNNKKIIVRVFGGLGNQLFCYAAARRISLDQSAELILDDKTGFINDPYNRLYQLDKFNIPCRKAYKYEILFPFTRIRFFLIRFFSKFRKFKNRKYIRHEGVDFDKRVLEIEVKGKIYLEGCWQSERYFKDIEFLLRKELQISPPIDELNINLYNQILKKESVFIHIRFFDAKINGTNNTNKCYYEKAIEYIERKINNPHFFIFSDNTKNVSTIVNLPEGKFTIVDINEGDQNAYKDLWLMTKCKHSIIANSTFSWWGAWLNEYKNKIVIAPNFKILDSKDRVTMWGFEGLLPESWIKINI